MEREIKKKARNARGDVLYTVSQGKIKPNSLADLTFLKEVDLS